MKTRGRKSKMNLLSGAVGFSGLCLIAALLISVSTGCKPQAQDTDLNPVGVYALASVDNKAVPCNVTHEGATLSVKSGTFTINADGTCHSLVVFSVPPHGDINREVKATYTRQGSELTMRWEGAGMTKGRVTGNQFFMTNEGMVFSYRK